MIFRVTLLWIIGIILIVPYAVYHLLWHAQRDEYAFLIVISLFWIFGFWGVVGPLIAASRIHKLMKSLDGVKNKRELQEVYDRNEGKEAVVDLISTENHIPRFLVRKFYTRIERKLRETSPDQRM